MERAYDVNGYMESTVAYDVISTIHSRISKSKNLEIHFHRDLEN